jgi:hypothetical protein
MALSPTWFFPPAGHAARGVALSSYSSGVAVADWTTPTLWPFIANSFTAASIVLATGVPGIADMATDAVSGVWAVNYAGTLWHVNSGGVIQSTINLPSGAYVGCAAPNGSGMALSAAGSVYTSAAVLRGTWPVATPLGMLATGTTLITPLAGSGVGLMNAANGTTGLIASASAVPTPTCFTATATLPLAIAGTQAAPSLSGAIAAALCPTDATAMVAVGSGRALVWRSPGTLADAWAQTQALTAGITTLSSLAWLADGFQVLAPSVASGVVQVLGYSAGVLSLLQTLTVSGACGVATTGDSLHALIAQSGQSQIMPLIFSGGTWVTGAVITGYPNITGIMALTSGTAVASFASGIGYLNFDTLTGNWSNAGSMSVGFVPSQMAVDSFNQVYLAGSGSLAVVSGLTMLASGSWTGSTAPTDIAVQDGRIALAIPAASGIFVWGLSSPGILSQQYSGALALGASVGLGLSNTTLFALGSASTTLYGFSGTPYVLTTPVSGAAAIWNGTIWTSMALGVGHTPACCGYDTSGQLNIMTTENSQWVFTSGGAFVSSGYVPSYATGQPQTIPLGLSAMLPFASGLYVSTSIPGALLEIA